MVGLDPLVTGLTAGSIYALVGISVNVIYRPTNIFNLAQGNLVMLGGLLCASALTALALPWYAAALLATLFVGLIAFATDLVAVAPVLSRRRGAGHSWLVTTLAVGLIIENLVGKIVGPDPMRIPPPPPLSLHPIAFGPFAVNSYQIGLIAVVALIVVGLEVFYATRTGRAIMAIAEDREASLLRGIDPRHLARLSFFVSGIIAGLAGILAGPMFYASVGLGGSLLIRGFEAAAVGGIGSDRGAILAGLLLGVVEAYSATMLAPGYQDTATLVLSLAVLLVRPQGLMGRTYLRAV
jgi:branched-chain amino acid transport system permease protein